MIRVLLIDDHAVLRSGLTSLLNTSADVRVVGDAKNGRIGVEKALQLKPDVVLMDLMMPEMDGVECTRRIKTLLPDTRVLVLTSDAANDGITLALEAGACGVLSKTVEFDELIDAIHRTARGERVLSQEIEQIIENAEPIPKLSPRQQEMLESITRGLTNPDIAKVYGISPGVVKEHLNALFAKLGAANRTEAVAIALRRHLLKI